MYVCFHALQHAAANQRQYSFSLKRDLRMDVGGGGCNHDARYHCEQNKRHSYYLILLSKVIHSKAKNKAYQNVIEKFSVHLNKSMQYQ